ncbi:EAL domain, c-di-GMP-specific phosphodiesterase class I (or its enzymatically inactive variant) [Modicisalibacter ilicicola DSM 19980]|uniref:EAL domain, c-di-GMP-specific phosphodiesterase class I (Or its enzymatically inactive variant) n=1 Tax=Modicisalibacter ilicicola DSM 19980 TaxID=1121942 RepID=A0A1M5DX89_9GAMM|nr:EAL domain-containing response regulator [Halomonas ilicicola]SHF71607.1 EAL domain, c-di-GMP-specific phosphodiesterase class I (or its enzymatically inactive variant) [Halomonas ilicicola DSM 19980]
MAQRALIVDDDIEIQVLGRQLLTRRGYDVVTANGLGELVCQPELLAAELILLDFDLGEFTGLDVMQYLSDLKLNAAIVLLSTCDASTAKRILDAGASSGLRMLGFLSKSRFLKTLDHVIGSLGAPQQALGAENLASAMQQGQLFPAYQPKHDLRSGRVVGVEALVRWKHPQRGVLYPDAFIPLAEQSDQIVELTWYMLAQVLGQQARWRARGWELDIAVNIPAQLFKTPDVLASFDRLLSRHGDSLRGITLELTESAGIECLVHARHLFTALRERGCRWSLDDFGTGYSSLTQLYRLPFDELKLDRSFVAHCDEDREAEAITLSIIELGKRLDMKVVAEGIETRSQHALLKRDGCDHGQGYLFARPMAEAEFATWFAKQTRQGAIVF